MTIGTIATIANGASLSNAVDLGGYNALGGIVMPAAWDAAVLTFQVSADNVTFQNFYDEFGTEVNLPTAASESLGVVPNKWLAWQYVKIRSGTSASPVNQTSARSITLIAV